MVLHFYKHEFNVIANSPSLFILIRFTYLLDFRKCIGHCTNILILLIEVFIDRNSFALSFNFYSGIMPWYCLRAQGIFQINFCSFFMIHAETKFVTFSETKFETKFWMFIIKLVILFWFWIVLNLRNVIIYGWVIISRNRKKK